MKNTMQFHNLQNLQNLLSTQESKEQLSEATNIPLSTINKWLDSNSRVVPKADSLIIMAKYFGCTVDYLLDVTIEKTP